MSNFTWNPNEDQNYIEAYGSETVNAVDFGKIPRKNFIMYAPDEVLTLQYSDPDPHKIKGYAFEMCYWGAHVGAKDTDGPDTIIDIQAGTFIMNGQNNAAAESAMVLYVNTTTHPPTIIKIGPQGKLILKNLAGFSHTGGRTCETNTHMELTGNGEFIYSVANGSLIGLGLYINYPVYAKDTSKINIDIMELEYEIPMIISSGIKLTQKSTMNVNANLFCFNSSEFQSGFIKVSDGASLTLLIGKRIEIPQKGCFILDSGKASITIPATLTTNLSVFDFLPDTTQLPKGIFDFLGDGESNQSTLSLSGVTGFQRAALKSGGFIAINGDPQNLNELSEKFNITVDGLDIHFQLK